MIRYINWRDKNCELETIDELDRNDFKTYREFKKELTRLLHEHISSGCNGAYISQRPCKDWLDK